MSKREELAEYAHAAWSNWMTYLFEKCELSERYLSGEKAVVIPAWAVERWQRQMNTPYTELSEAEKESDRAEADRMLAIVHGTCYCGCDACKYCEQLLESEAS